MKQTTLSTPAHFTLDVYADTFREDLVPEDFHSNEESLKTVDEDMDDPMSELGRLQVKKEVQAVLHKNLSCKLFVIVTLIIR